MKPCRYCKVFPGAKTMADGLRHYVMCEARPPDKLADLQREQFSKSDWYADAVAVAASVAAAAAAVMAAIP